MKRIFKRKKREPPKTSFTVEDFEGDGISWLGKFAGRIIVSDKTTEVCQAAIKEVRTKAKSGKYNFDAKKKVKVVVRISVGGLATINLKSGTFITKNPVHRILGWFPDAKEKDVFGIVVKGEGRQLSGPADEFCCVVLKSPQAVSALAAIKQLMAIVFHAPAADKESPSMSPGAGKAAVDPNKWDCIDCHFFNKNDDLECVMCGCGKNAEPASLDRASSATNDDAPGVGEVMNIDDANIKEMPDGDLPEIPIFIASHDPDIEPDYVNLPRGIEAVELVASAPGANQDYVNLAETVEENEAYLKKKEVLALAAEASGGGGGGGYLEVNMEDPGSASDAAAPVAGTKKVPPPVKPRSPRNASTSSAGSAGEEPKSFSATNPFANLADDSGSDMEDDDDAALAELWG